MTYKLLRENEKVRVLDIHLKPGEKAPMHDHPHNHVIYVMKKARFKLTFADGKSGEFDLISRADVMEGSRIPRNKRTQGLLRDIILS